MVSSTKPAMVSYSIETSAALSLTAGQTAKVVLSVSSTVGGTYVPICSYKNGNTGTLVIGLNTASVVGGTVSALIPAGYYIKLDTTGTTAGVTVSIVAQQEKLLG